MRPRVSDIHTCYCEAQARLGAALDVLAGESNRRTVQKQRAVREQLSHCPIQRLILLNGLSPQLKQLLEFPMHGEIVRDSPERLGDQLKLITWRAGLSCG